LYTTSPQSKISLRVHGNVEVFGTHKIHEKFKEASYSLWSIEVELAGDQDALAILYQQNLQLLCIRKLNTACDAFSVNLEHFQNLVIGIKPIPPSLGKLESTDELPLSTVVSNESRRGDMPLPPDPPADKLYDDVELAI
jgi:hypothetical protein